MRVTLLGHASVLVESPACVALINPVFDDPFGEGMVASCPARRVHARRLPKIDLVILSDALPGHLDIATLARLRRDCVVMCPKDPSILYVLDKLGFTKVRPTAASVAVKFGEQLEVVTTPSIRKVTEFGIAIKDESGTFWDPVSTQLTPRLVEHVRSHLGMVHLLFAAYATQDFSYVGIQRPGYPGQFLRDGVTWAKDVAPAMVVPASAGFRFVGPFEWTNRFLFPISRARFLAELARAAPALPSSFASPGDVFEIGHGTVERRAGASPFVTMTEDDTDRIAFDPTAPVPPLTDPNCDGYPPELMDGQVTASFEELTRFVRAAYVDQDPLVLEHRRIEASYGLGVVFPDGHERWLRVEFGADRPTIQSGDGAIRDALNTQRIAASVLTARARYERSYHYTGGLSRVTIISPAKLVDGKVVVEPRQPPDLLMHSIRVKPPGWAHHLKQILDFRLVPFVASGSPR